MKLLKAILPILLFCFLVMQLALIDSMAASKIENPEPALDQRLFHHRLRQTDYWKEKLDLPFEQRIFMADAIALNYAYLLNQKDQKREVVAPISLNSEEASLIAQALKGIHPLLRSHLENKFGGIILVSGLKFFALADYFQNKDLKPQGGYILLDYDAIRGRSLNQLMTEKEKKIAGNHHHELIETRFIDLKKDSPVEALRYLLTHEFSHLLAIGTNVHPNWWLSIEDLNANNFEFSKLGWEWKKGQRPILRGNMDDHLKAQGIKSQLKKYESLSIPSLYASTNPFEDFAESVAHILWESEGHTKEYVLKNSNGKNERIKIRPFHKSISSKKLEIINKILQM